MKNPFIKITAALFISLLSSQVSLASGISEKIVEKARYAVEQAAPDDWYTLAESAEKCIRKGVNLKEAVAWLEESLAIRRTAYNLEIQGDYFAKSQLPLKAVNAYAESFRLGVLHQEDYSDSNISEKIKQQVMKLGKAYDGDLKVLRAGELSQVYTGERLREVLGQVW